MHGVGGSLSPPGLRPAGASRAEVGLDLLEAELICELGVGRAWGGTLPGQGEAAGLPELLGELGADAGVGLRHGVGGSLSPPGLRSAGACRAEVGCDFLGTDSSTGFVARGRGEERGNGARVKEPRDWRGARFTSMLEISGSGSFPARNSRHTMGVVLGGARRQALLDVGWGSVVPRRCCERRTWGGGGGGEGAGPGDGPRRRRCVRLHFTSRAR